jgi:hypothetical protein
VKIIEGDVSRERVIRFCVAYDLHKKSRCSLPADLDEWLWSDPDALDQKLADNGLKRGVLAAYRT